MINFFKGILIGIAMAAPVGPLALLCIRRSLTKGHIEGVATGLGVALADGFYALVAALGLSAISLFILERKEYLFMGGGIMLVLLGVRALKNPPSLSEDDLELEKLNPKGFMTTLLQTSLITLTNPMTIVTFIAAFSAVGFQGQQTPWQATTIALGVFCGSLVWFMMLALIVGYFRKKVTPFVYRMINTVSGALLIAYGIIFLGNAARELLIKAFRSYL